MGFKMIKLIVNGYYRTGSTMIFRIMEESNPDKIVLVEPLHLRKYYNILKRDNKNHLPYEKFNQKTFRKLMWSHSKIKFKYISNKEKVFPYFDLLNKQKEKIILQTNRAHFFLNDFSERYKCKYIHLIRNPLDEWASFYEKNSENKHTKKYKSKDLLAVFKILFKKPSYLKYLLKQIISYLKHNPLESGPFQINKEFNEKITNFDKELETYDKFLIMWTKINESAINQAKNNKKGEIFWYENIVDNEKELEKMEKFSGMNFNKNVIKINKKATFKFDKKEVVEFWKRTEKLGIKNKVKEIIKTSNNKGLLKRYLIK